MTVSSSSWRHTSIVCTVGLWDLDTGEPLGELEWGSRFPSAQALACACECGRGRVAAMAGRLLWQATVRRAPVGLDRRRVGRRAAYFGDETIWAVALGMLARAPGRRLRRGVGWLTTLDLESGEHAIPSYESPDYMRHRGRGRREVDGHAVAVSGNFSRDRPGDFARVGPCRRGATVAEGSLVGHYGGSKALAITRLDGRPVLVSGGFDRAVRVWDLKDSLDQMPDRVEYHYFEWLQACELGGRPVVVSKSFATISFSKSWVWHKKVDEELNEHRKSHDRSFLIDRGSTVERQVRTPRPPPSRSSGSGIKSTGRRSMPARWILTASATFVPSAVPATRCSASAWTTSTTWPGLSVSARPRAPT